MSAKKHIISIEKSQTIMKIIQAIVWLLVQLNSFVLSAFFDIYKSCFAFSNWNFTCSKPVPPYEFLLFTACLGERTSYTSSSILGDRKSTRLNSSHVKISY